MLYQEYPNFSKFVVVETLKKTYLSSSRFLSCSLGMLVRDVWRFILGEVLKVEVSARCLEVGNTKRSVVVYGLVCGVCFLCGLFPPDEPPLFWWFWSKFCVFALIFWEQYSVTARINWKKCGKWSNEMGGSVISTLSFVLVVLWWVNCFLGGNHLSTWPHEISCRYADGWLYHAIVWQSVHGLRVKGMGRSRVFVSNPFVFFYVLE